MILRLDPEHRDRGNAVLFLHTLGELQRGERLVQREQRSAEETSLLTGDDGDGLFIGDERRRLARRRRSTAPLELRAENRRELRSLARMFLRARDRVGPRRRGRGVAGEKRREGRE